MYIYIYICPCCLKVVYIYIYYVCTYFDSYICVWNSGWADWCSVCVGGVGGRLVSRTLPKGDDTDR